MVNDRSIGLTGSSSKWLTFHQTFHFSINDHSNGSVTCIPEGPPPGQFIQVISHQVITGEQGKKYCETLPAHLERDDLEFSGVVPIEKTNIDSLNLPCHKVYRSLKLECYIE